MESPIFLSWVKGLFNLKEDCLLEKCKRCGSLLTIAEIVRYNWICDSCMYDDISNMDDNDEYYITLKSEDYYE